MTSITLASSPFVILRLSGHTLAYVNVQPELTWADANALLEKRNARVLAQANTPANVTPVEADPRARFVGELRLIVELECKLTQRGMRDHWFGWFYEDGQKVKVDIWAEQRRMLYDYGHDIMPFAKLAGIQRVEYPVYLKLERGMLMIEDVLEKVKVA